MVRDFWLAEDLAQETFLQLHRKIATFRGDSAFATWLHRMTVNIVLMRLRKHVLPVVLLDQMMTDTSVEHAGHGFGTCDRTQPCPRQRFCKSTELISEDMGIFPRR
jgi:RNA polymerase sigma-70 factor (ECF subfamily)